MLRRRIILVPLGVCAVVLVTIAASGQSTSSRHLAAAPTTLPPTTVAPTTTTTAPAPLIAPLTGFPQPDAALRDRPALAVKIDDAPEARPQFGIENADVVYEEKVEGGLSRFMAIFQSADSDHVGPVRSLRSTDAYVLKPLGPSMIAYSGGIQPFKDLLAPNGLTDLSDDSYPSYYGRDPARPYVHSLYTSTTQLRQLTPAGMGPPQPLFTYLNVGQSFTAAGAQPIHSVSVRLGAETTFDWTWDPTSALWKRGTDGMPHNITTGQLGYTNVIVQFVNYDPLPYTDPAGNPVDQANTVGTGDSWVLSGGQLVVGRWVRPSLDQPAQYNDAAGQPIKLQPGKTWVTLVPTGEPTQINP
jgi:hypothetical protein